MAAFPIGCSISLIKRNCSRLKPFLQQESVILNHARYNHMFKHLQRKKKHDTKYEYDVSKDPKEWEFVEKLMPLETVPVPKEKPNYSSGWRPQKEESLRLPYFVERSKNHMLSVYLKNHIHRQIKVTKLKRIHGDLWRLHDELKAHIENEVGTQIGSHVNEGNGVIQFRGDYVYYIEQWLLKKGF